MKYTKRLRKEVKISISLAGILFLVILCVGFAGYQIKKYESSVLDIYADAQDAYVQLVLDQINIATDRTEYEIVEDILGTLDASSNRYWTFSSDEALIFVKDVTETNRYKGFTTSTYYVSEEAKEFIDNLRTNRVVHEIIPINERNYVASGVAFEYNDTMYQMCLLTNPRTVLDHNVYLNARINLCVMIGLVLLLFLLTAIRFLLSDQQKEEKLKTEKKANEELRKSVEKLTAALERNSLFDTHLTVFNHKILPMLQEKLETRGVAPYCIFFLTYETEGERKSFLEQSQILLDHRVFRFHDEAEKRIILVTVRQTKNEVIRVLKPLVKKGIRLQRIVVKEERETDRT